MGLKLDENRFSIALHTLQLICIRLQSLFNDSAIARNRSLLCDRSQSLCNRFANALQPLCNRFETALQSL
jgi:hypothetical protein